MLHTRTLILALLCLFGVLNSTAQSLKSIVMYCQDEHGAYLGTDTITLPADSCFFLLPPKFPFFDCKNYDPAGTNVCIDSDVLLEMTFTAQGFVGAGEVMPTHVEQLEDNYSYLLFDANAEQPTIWSIDEQGERLVREPYAPPLSPRAVWTAVRAGQSWQWRNEWAWKTMAQLAEGAPAVATDEGTSFTATVVAQAATAKTEHPTWTFLHPTTQIATRIIARRYRAKAYFNAQIEFRDVAGQALRADSLIVAPAGEDLQLTFSPLQGRPLLYAKAMGLDDAGKITAQAFSADAHGIQHFTIPILSAQQQIVLTFGQPSAIAHPTWSTETPPLYDLSGRLTTAHRPGLYLRRGQRPLLR